MSAFLSLPMGGGIKVQHFTANLKKKSSGTVYFPQPVKDISKTFLIINIKYPFYFKNVTNNSVYVIIDGVNESEYLSIDFSVQVVEFI